MKPSQDDKSPLSQQIKGTGKSTFIPPQDMGQPSPYYTNKLQE